MELMGWDNIEYILWGLWGVTIILIFLVVYNIRQNKKNNQKPKSNVNMIHYNTDKDSDEYEYKESEEDEEDEESEEEIKIDNVLNTKKEEDWSVPVHLKNNKEKIKEEEKEGVSVHLNKKELKRMNNFKISSISLFKANFSKNNNVVNGVLDWKTNLIRVYDFYFSIHKFLNNLFVKEIYSIGKEDLFSLHKAIGKMNLDLFKNTIQKVSESNGLIKEGSIEGELLFKKIIIGAIDNDNYLILKEEHKEIFKKKIESIKKVLEKTKLEEWKKLTTNEKRVLEEYNIEKEIQQEIQKVVGRRVLVSLLKFDIEDKEIHINIHHNDILNKKIADLVAYYKDKGNLNEIVFYI